METMTATGNSEAKQHVIPQCPPVKNYNEVQ